MIRAVRLSSSLLLTPILTDFGKYPFSAPHFPGHCFGPIPAPGSFAASAFTVPPANSTVPSHKASARFGSSGLSLLGAPAKWGKKKENNSCLIYMLSGIASG